MLQLVVSIALAIWGERTRWRRGDRLREIFLFCQFTLTFTLTSTKSACSPYFSGPRIISVRTLPFLRFYSRTSHSHLPSPSFGLLGMVIIHVNVNYTS